MFKKSLWIPVLAFCVAILGFKGPEGGEGFEIYMSGKLVMQQFGNQMNTVKSLTIDKSSYNAELSVKYYHCGQAGKNRAILIKDDQNKILKEWRFGDGVNAMSCNVKDIVDLKKDNATLNLYYSSKELPAGRKLVSINTRTTGVTARL